MLLMAEIIVTYGDKTDDLLGTRGLVKFAHQLCLSHVVNIECLASTSGQLAESLVRETTLQISVAVINPRKNDKP